MTHDTLDECLLVDEGWMGGDVVHFANFDPLHLCSLSARLIPPWRR